MVKVDWGHSPSNSFETGVSKGVLYPPGKAGVAWTGLISVNETPEGAAFKPKYQDGIKIRTSVDTPEYSSTIEAFTYPDEFSEFDGTTQVAKGFYVEEQIRKPFGLSYQTLIGGGSPLLQGHYKIHLIYNAFALPSNKDYSTLDANPTAMPFSWEISTKPVFVPGFKPASHFIIDSRELGFTFLKDFEGILYGNPSVDARLPTVGELVSIFQNQ